MQVKDFGGVMIDVCANCKGMWFDWMELMKMDEKHEGGGQALAEAMLSPRVNDAGRGQIACPKCGTPMRIHNYGRAQDVKVDECYACGGFFLDSGELRVIREDFMSDAAYAQFVDGVVNDIPGMAEYQQDLERRYLRGKAMLRMTRFLRPSWIIPKLLGGTPQEEVSVVLPGLIDKARRDPAQIKSPEMRAYLDNYMSKDESERTPEQRAFIDEYGC
jgi:Zn-finger nucleic acid-binding protein